MKPLPPDRCFRQAARELLTSTNFDARDVSVKTNADVNPFFTIGDVLRHFHSNGMPRGSWVTVHVWIGNDLAQDVLDEETEKATTADDMPCPVE